MAELDGVELNKIREFVNADDERGGTATYHGVLQSENNLRVPVYISYLLRQSIIRGGSSLPLPLTVETESKLLEMIDSLVANYHSIQELLSTPPPFILSETTRTFLILYVVTLPLAFRFLLHDDDNLSNVIPYYLAVFLSTYSLVGIEMVSHSLDHGYGSKTTFVKYKLSLCSPIIVCYTARYNLSLL